MECFKCHCYMVECKSKFGFYHKCPKCGKIFESQGQTFYNSNHYENRKDSKK